MGDCFLHGQNFGSGGNIKSVQRGLSIFDDLDDTMNITIANVDTTKSIVIAHSYFPSSSSLSSYNTSITAVAVELSDSRRITAYRGYKGKDMLVAWQVIEFESVKSLQTGQAVSSSGFLASPYTPVYPVDINKSILYATCITSDTSNLCKSMLYSYQLSDNGTLSFYNSIGGEDNWIYYWQLVEFN